MHDRHSSWKMGQNILPKLTFVRLFQLQLWSLLAESYHGVLPYGTFPTKNTKPNLEESPPSKPIWLFLFLAHWQGHSHVEELCLCG